MKLVMTAVALIAPYMIATVVIASINQPNIKSEVKTQTEVSQGQTVEVKTDIQEVKQESLSEMIMRVAEENGIDKYDLLAIAINESSLDKSVVGINPKAVGDNGDSRGCFQINRPAHPDISDELAFDCEWSAKWTANRMKANGYPEYRTIAIRKHNGNPRIEKTRIYYVTVDNIARKLKEGAI